MTTGLAERRKARSLTLFLLAGALVAVAAITIAIESRSLNPSTNAGPVLPGIEEQIGGAQRITVTSADATYRIERTQQGWAMRDRDDYPVLSSRLAQLTEGLETLRYVRRMTSDAARHERLGVTDPREGGRGVLLQIEDGRGALLVNLILGVETGGTYVRRPDEAQTWAVQGELPPLRDAASWLDLQPMQLTADRIGRVEIMPPEGRAYILERDAADQPWRLASPALSALVQSTLAATAEHITRLTPTDVRTAPAIQGTPRARIRATTFDGIVIDAELIASDNRTWIKLVARASTPEQEAAAVALNTPASDWAYALSDMEVGELAPPLSRLVPGAE
ncbi:MAG: DUF4340 domain-containing protein [Hyphomonadaceae bacterium]|nr:DUF4340 domain-containing protein [Hyphomonadaceae bacterium]